MLVLHQVWDFDMVDEADELLEVDILRLFEDRDVERAGNTVSGGVGLSSC